MGEHVCARKRDRNKNSLMLALRIDPSFRLTRRKCDKIESLDQRLREKKCGATTGQ